MGSIMFGFAWSKQKAADTRLELEKSNEIFTEL